MQQNGNLTLHLHMFAVCINVLTGHISLPFTLVFKCVTLYLSKKNNAEVSIW